MFWQCACGKNNATTEYTAKESSKTSEDAVAHGRYIGRGTCLQGVGRPYGDRPEHLRRGVDLENSHVLVGVITLSSSSSSSSSSVSISMLRHQSMQKKRNIPRPKNGTSVPKTKVKGQCGRGSGANLAAQSHAIMYLKACQGRCPCQLLLLRNFISGGALSQNRTRKQEKRRGRFKLSSMPG